MSIPSTPSIPPPPPPSPPPARPKRTMVYVVVIAVVVVAVLLLVVLAAPLFTGSGSTQAAAVLTYSGARPVADHAVSGFDGGGWTLLIAAGLVTTTTESIPVNDSALSNTTCTFTLVTSLSSLTLPGFAGNRSAGASPAWEFIYRNSTDALALVSVINGQGSVLATLSGLECAIYAQLFTAIPGNVIDSSQAAADVEPKAASFLAEYPNASAEFGLIGGVAFLGKGTGPEWSVQYNTCLLSPSATGTGSEFNATVNALTGKVLGTNTTTGVSCGSSSTTAAHVIGAPIPALPATAASTPRGRPTRLS